MSDDRPIGVYDSGSGGLTVLEALRKVLPMEKFVYLADTKNLPYGDKTTEQLHHFAVQNVGFLKSKGVKALVVGCNTSSAASLEVIRQEAQMPVVEVIEPCLREGIQRTKSGKLALIATRATIRSGAYGRALARSAPHISLVQKATPLLVPLVENEVRDKRIIDLVLAEYLGDLGGDWDVLLLGCTHYGLLKDRIARIIPHKEVVDSAMATALATQEILDKENLLSCGKTCGGKKVRIYLSSGDGSDSLKKIANEILGSERVAVEEF